MDPLTHAASGIVAMLALPSRPATRWGLVLAGAACAAPDMDLAFIHTPLQFLQIHRGISHSFAFMPLFALLLAWLCWPLWRARTPGHWSFFQVWLFCCAMILLHIWLDMFTTYGTMVFLPFSHYRVRLNSIYIIELLISLPLLWGILRWRHLRLERFILLWIIVFPLFGWGMNMWHTKQCRDMFTAQNRQVEHLHVLPDAFAPFFWRVIFEEQSAQGPLVHTMGLDFLGRPRTSESTAPGAPAPLIEAFKSQSVACETYFNFAMLPVMDKLRPEDRPDNVQPDASMHMFYDLRFGSDLKFMRRLLAMRPNADMPFQLLSVAGAQEADLPETRLELIRLRFSDSGRDSFWHVPERLGRPVWWQWLLGVY